MLEGEGIGGHVEGPEVAFAGVADIYNQSPALELAFLRNMQVAAEVEAWGYDVESIEETFLPAAPSAGKRIRQTDCTAVRDQNIHVSAFELR